MGWYMKINIRNLILVLNLVCEKIIVSLL